MTSHTTRRRAPSIAAVATAAACVFLAAQLRAGHDPGLGTVVPVAAKQAAPAPSHSSAPLVTKSSGGG